MTISSRDMMIIAEVVERLQVDQSGVSVVEVADVKTKAYPREIEANIRIKATRREFDLLTEGDE